MKIKKSLALLVALMTITATSCSSQTETKKNNKSTTNTSVVESNTESKTKTVQTDSSETESIETVPAEEDSYYEFFGSKLYYPSSFQKNVASPFFWNGALNTNDTIYYKVGGNFDYSSDTDYTYKDVPEIIFDDFFDILRFDAYFISYDDTFSDTVETEEEVDIKGYTFLRRTGTMHTETDEETHEVSYAAYYGVMDFKTYGEGEFNIPTYWIAFSEVTDVATKDDLATIVDKTASDFDWVAY